MANDVAGRAAGVADRSARVDVAASRARLLPRSDPSVSASLGVQPGL